MEADPDPDNPRDVESRLSLDLTFKISPFSDIIFSILSVLENLAIIFFSMKNGGKNIINQHISDKCQIPYFSNSKLHLFPLNTVFISILKFKFGIKDTAITILLSSLYSFLSMYFFRNMLFSLRLSKYTNVLSALFLLYPLERLVQQSFASRDSLLLILIFVAVIEYQLKEIVTMNIVLLLASLTGCQGSFLFIGFITDLAIKGKHKRMFVTMCFFVVAVYLSKEVGFYLERGGLINDFIELSVSIGTHRQCEGVIQMLIIPLFGAFAAFAVSRAVSINTVLLIILAFYGPAENGQRAAIFGQVLSFVGFSYAMTPRIKNGVYVAAVLFIAPLIYFAYNTIVNFEDKLELVE